jgi:hypothetical protein
MGLVEPVNVVATPRAERPVFLTMTYAPVPPEPQVTYIPDVSRGLICRFALLFE